jgi:hypothetical protein
LTEPTRKEAELGRRPAALLSGALALLFLAQALPASLGESLTWDETGYIAAGYANLWQGDYGLNADHPPLMQKLSALPLAGLVADAPPANAPRFLETSNPRATYGREFFFGHGLDVEAATLRARLPVMGLSAALILALYAWGSALFGAGPALLTAALAALCPPLLAHGRLATEDMGCTAGMFVAVWLLWRASEQPSWTRTVACGLAVGFALLTKYTALLLAPIFVGLWLLPPPGARRLPLPRAAALTGVAFAVVSLGYGWIPRPDLFFAGIGKIYPDVAPDYSFYLAGRVSESPFALHGLASVALKLPLSALVLLGIAGVRATRAGREGARSAWLLLPPAVVLLASAFDLTNPGVRRVLPAIPFLLLFAGQAAFRPRHPALVATLALLAGGAGLEAAAAYPHHLAYLNPLGGGTRNGPYVFDESNVDWGQDLPALAAWQRAHQREGETLRLYYFGSAVPAAYGVDAVRFELDQVEAPPPGLYAISAHYLVFFRKLAVLRGLDSDWLTKYEPIDRAGSSTWLYRFEPPARASADAASVSRPSAR